MSTGELRRTNIAAGKSMFFASDLGERVVAWTLPEPDADLAGWISEQTTARIIGDVLTWPWQTQP